MLTVNDFTHFSDFGFYALKGVLRRQDFRIPETTIYFSRNFYFTTDLLHQWNQVFSLPPETNDVPFSFHWRPLQSNFLRMLNQLGVNFKNVLHLGQERTFPDPDRKLQVGKVYRLESALKDICALRNDRVALVSENLIKDLEGHVVSLGFDYVFVKNVSHKVIHQLENHELYNKHPVDQFLGLQKKPARLIHTESRATLRFPEGMGLKFGMVAGDLNPIHINRPLAKAFGFKQPIAHGACVSNYILKALSHDLRMKIKDFRISFSKPVQLGHSANLHIEKNKFELLDVQNNLLAFGTFTEHE